MSSHVADMAENRVWWRGNCKFTSMFSSTNREVKIVPGKITYRQMHENAALSESYPTKKIIVETISNHRLNGSKVIVDFTTMENGKSSLHSKTFTFENGAVAEEFDHKINEEKSRQYIKSSNMGNYESLVNSTVRLFFAGGRNPGLEEFYFACSPDQPTLLVEDLLTSFGFICVGGIKSEDDAKLFSSLLDMVSNNIFLLTVLLRCNINPMPKSELLNFLNLVSGLYSAHSDNALLFMKLLCFSADNKVTSDNVQKCVHRFTNVKREHKYQMSLASLENDLRDAKRLSYQLLNHYATVGQVDTMMEVITAVPSNFLVSSFVLIPGSNPQFHFANLFFQTHLRGRTQQLLNEFRKGDGCSNEFFRHMLECGFDHGLTDITLEVMRSIVFTDGVPVVRELFFCQNLAEEIYKCILARRDLLNEHNDSARQLLELSIAFECFSWNVQLRTLTNLSRLLRNDPQNGYTNLRTVMKKLSFQKYMIMLCKANFVDRVGKSITANLEWCLRTSDALTACVYGYITLLWRCEAEGDEELVGFLRGALTQQSYTQLLGPHMPLRNYLLDFLASDFGLEASLRNKLSAVPWIFTSWQHFQRSFLRSMCYGSNRLMDQMETIIHLAAQTEEFGESLVLLIGRLDSLAQRKAVLAWMRDVLHRLASHSRAELQAAGVTMVLIVDIVIENISDQLSHMDPNRSQIVYEQLLQVFLKSPRCWGQLIREYLPGIKYWPECRNPAPEVQADPTAPPLEPVIAEAELFHDAVQDGDTTTLATAQAFPAQASPVQASAVEGSPIAVVAVPSFT